MTKKYILFIHNKKYTLFMPSEEKYALFIDNEEKYKLFMHNVGEVSIIHT